MNIAANGVMNYCRYMQLSWQQRHQLCRTVSNQTEVEIIFYILTFYTQTYLV